MKIRYMFTFIIFCPLGYVEPLIVPEPTGPFVTGVQDFEFLDTFYPSPFAEDESGRRIMFRAYYPVCNRTDFSADNHSCGETDLGRRRLYFEEGEWEAYFGYTGIADPMNLTSLIFTHSYLNAPMAVELGPRPVIIYSHGATSWVSDNTALMEELASNGYAVFALASPGISGGVLYPNGDTVGISPAFIAAMQHPDTQLLPQSSDIHTRYETVKNITESMDGIASFGPRYRDDQIAMADYLQSNNSTLLRRLVRNDGFQGLIYSGFSFGGTAAGNAAHRDERANGAVNLDGFQGSTELLGNPIRVPLLTFVQNAGLVPFYYNEFFWEELESMGTDPDVTRVLMPENTTHLDIADFRFLPQALRDNFFPELNSTEVDGDNLHAILVDFILGFADTQTGQRTDWTPNDSFSKFQDIESIDTSYVADWAQTATSSASLGIVGISTRVKYATSIAFMLMTL